MLITGKIDIEKYNTLDWQERAILASHEYFKEKDKVYVFEGKTSTEAIEKGLNELKVSKNKVDIKILESEDKRSFFSILTPRVVKVEMRLKDNVVEEKKPEVKKPEVNKPAAPVTSKIVGTAKKAPRLSAPTSRVGFVTKNFTNGD